MQLPLTGNLSLSLAKTANETDGTLAAALTFFGISANANASFATQSAGTAHKLGLEEIIVKFGYTDSSSLFHMDVTVEYDSNCTVGVKVSDKKIPLFVFISLLTPLQGASASGNLLLNFAEGELDQGFAFSAAYYSCANVGDTQWVIQVDQSDTPLQIYSVTLSNVSLHLTGTKSQTAPTDGSVATNSTLWSGTAQGQFTLGEGGVALQASGIVRFDSNEGVTDLQISASFDSEYLEASFDISYKKIDCNNITYQYGVFDPSDINTYNGGKGSGSVHIKSIHTRNKLVVLFTHLMNL